MTSHKAQGQTVDRTLIHHNTEGGMHGQREAYVNVTRARLATTTYTQDRERAGEQAARAIDKTRATANDGLTPESKRPGWRRQPERMKQTRQAWRQTGRLADRAAGKAAERSSAQALRPPTRPLDDLRFTPASYADVTLKPGERFDPVRDLLAQHVPPKLQVAQDLRAEAMAFARQTSGQFTSQVRAEQVAIAFARDTAEQMRAQIAQHRAEQQAQESAARALEAQQRAQAQQHAEKQHAEKLRLEQEAKQAQAKQQDKGRDQGWNLSL